MGHWEDFDEDAKKADKRIKVGFSVNFKKMSYLIDRIVEETGETDEHYPKDILLKIWGCDMLVFFLLFVLSYGILIVATAPFLFFYGYVLFDLIRAWKRFKYSMKTVWLITVFALVVEIAVAYYLRLALFG